MQHTEPKFAPYRGVRYTRPEMLNRSREFYQYMDKRRTVRDISDKAVPREVIENIVMTASTSPSGAHKQPWTFCVVANPTIKKQIREAAEKEEYLNYHGRMSEEWIEDLQAFGLAGRSVEVQLLSRPAGSEQTAPSVEGSERITLGEDGQSLPASSD